MPADDPQRLSTLPAVRLSTDDLSPGPWVFARQVSPPPLDLPNGSLVEVLDASSRFVGHALYNAASDIRLRMLSRGRKTDLDRPRAFLLARLTAADRLRRRTLRLPETTDAYRIAHAEGDDLPGLVVDRLASTLVCEHHSLGFWRLRADVEWALRQLYRDLPDLAVVHRVPRAAAKAEGFEPEPSPSPTPSTEVVIHEHGLAFPVEPGGGLGGGHKTGWFCDQRENRVAVAAFARGRDVLDLFCNAGGFALHAARAGARSVHAVDLDEVALDRARRAAELNSLQVELVHADAFDHLRAHQAGAARAPRPGLIVVDPHKLIPGRTLLETGMRKYLDLNALAFAVVRPGGLVATFSCSGLLAEPAFVGMLFQAARRAGRGVKLLAQLGAGPDHPQRPDFSRSRYLKGAILAVD